MFTKNAHLDIFINIIDILLHYSDAKLKHSNIELNNFSACGDNKTKIMILKDVYKFFQRGIFLEGC